jgi:N-acetylmuramoyl-L-alanine amidase
MTFLLYLGKVMLCSGILLSYYWLFLRNRRFHHYNRFYLQATLLLSVILPFIRIPVWNKPQNAVSQAVYQTLEVLTVNYGEAEGLDAGPGALARLFTVENLLYGVYGIGIVALLWVLIRSLLYIRKISKQYPFEHIGGLKFFTTREPGTPFSFFRSIFWNRDLPFNSRDGQQIFRHELFHVQQKHSSDIILTELITAFFWYNPFFHLLKKEMKAIHEFLADQYAVSDSDRYAYAELLVLQTLKANHISISNYFFQNHIKRRIAMITNNQSTRITYRSRLMALPVLAFLFCTIALYAQRSTNSVTTIFRSGSAQKPITVVIVAGHGGVDAGAASTDGKVKEKDLALQISQKIQQLAASYNINVVMTRTNDGLPDNTTDKNDGLKARTALTEKAKADLFISIHISAADDNKTDPRYSGFEVFVSNKDDDRTKQSKQLGSAVVQELSKLYNTNPALLQRSMNIWVLERTPCPALLIECGYITNEKDLAFISNSINQEAIAKKILEGIVKYKDNPAAAANQPEPTPQPVAQHAAVVEPAPMAAPAATALVAKPASAATSTTGVIPTSVALPVALKTPAQEPTIEPKDPIIPKLAAHYCRNVRYPQLALANNTDGVVYFSLAVDNNGNISNFQLYEKAPADAAQLTKMVTIGYSSTDTPTTGAISQETTMKMLQEEVKKAFDKKPNLSGYTPQSAQYFFQVNFHVQKRQC